MVSFPPKMMVLALASLYLACRSEAAAAAAAVRGSNLQGNAASIRRRVQGGDMNNMNKDEATTVPVDDDDDSITTTTTTTTTTAASFPVTTAAPDIVYGGVSGAPPGSLAAEDSGTPGGAGATGGSTSAQCPTVVYTDVIIVGAGMAGISAAARLQQVDPTLEYLILESTHRVGGRVRSKDFGVPGNTWKIEDGANWIYGDIPDNPLLTLAQANAFATVLGDFMAFNVYGSNGLPIDRDVYDAEYKKFLAAVEDVTTDIDNQWSSSHESYNDPGVVAKLAEHGWVVGTDNSLISNIDRTIQWFELEWEYAQNDTSVRFYPVEEYEPLYPVDPRGFDFLIQTFFQQNANTANLRNGTRVMSISYNETIVGPSLKTYKARVSTTNGVECTDYIAQRVISTVSAGVLNAGIVDFQPSLRYSESEYNPMQVGEYVKIFYQFSTQFWENEQFIQIIPNSMEDQGACSHWQNLGYFQAGSNILECVLVSEAFWSRVGGRRSLTEETISALLDPLRAVYGTDVVGTPIATYATELHTDANIGFGAYSNWRVGYSFTDFAHFYGGIETLVPYCEHNGCNALQEWILHFSGSHTCYDHSETVHGAYFAGQRSANFVLAELGYVVDTDSSPCDTNWFWLTME